MARRISEMERLANEGTPLQPLGPITGVSTAREVRFHKTFSGVYSMQWNYNGTLLAVGFGSGGIQLYDGEGNNVGELRPSRQGGTAVMVLRFSPKDPELLYAGTAEGHIFVYNVRTSEQMEKIEEPNNEINTMDFTVDGYNFITSGKDLNVRVYETKTSKNVRTYEGFNQQSSTVAFDKNVVANTQRVFSIKCHTNNQFIFISGGWDNHIKIWDIRDNDGIKRSIMGPHVAGDTLDMRDGNILAGSWAALHALQLYDYTSGDVVKEIKFPHKDGAFLYTSLFVNDTTVAAGGSGTNSMEVIDIKTNKHHGGYKSTGPIHVVDSALNGRFMAVGAATDTFAIVKLHTE